MFWWNRILFCALSSLKNSAEYIIYHATNINHPYQIRLVILKLSARTHVKPTDPLQASPARMAPQLSERTEIHNLLTKKSPSCWP